MNPHRHCLALLASLASGLFINSNAIASSPVLVSESGSTRAVALESVTFRPEPFAPTSPFEFGLDQRTRVILFCLNLALQPGDDASLVTVDAEDAAHAHYDFNVEFVQTVSGQPGLTQVVVRLSEGLTDVGDVLVRLTYRGAQSNRVRIGIGHVGGGPVDDSGSSPTPAQSFTIGGQVTDAGTGLAGVIMRLTGTQAGQTTTDSMGFYAFNVISFGDYAVTPFSPFHDYLPQNLSFLRLTGSKTEVSWNAVRRMVSVNGQLIDESGRTLDGIVVTLTDVTNKIVSNTSTANGGNFSFPRINAGFDYKLTFANSICDFPSQNINALTENFIATIKGTRRSHEIKGQVTDATNQGVAGVTVNLGSSQTAVTDISGNYSLTVLAGFDYEITPAKTHYLFTPVSQMVTAVDRAQIINFNAVPRKYTIHGRVADVNGRGLIGISVALTGSETNQAITNSAGDYSLSASALGNYSVTPSIPQNYYSFNPSGSTLTAFSSDQTVDFSAQLTPFSDPSYVVEFDGTPKTVDYGEFWSGGIDLGHFFWEFWARPGENAGGTYLLSDGYGGAHALLFGFGFYGASEPGRYQLFGDTFDGTLDLSHITFFGGDQGPAVGEWAHYAVGWDGQNIITYFDGVPVGKTVFTGPRQTPGQYGGGHLLIGGSDHNNFIGRIAEVRGYEDSNPRELNTATESAFSPETVFSVNGSLLSYYFRPAQKIADLSFGYNGITHIGIPRGTTNGIPYDCGTCPPPQFVIDSTAPNFHANTPPNQITVASPAPVPGNARVFDSFGRANAVYLFGAKGGLGLTEGGAVGIKSWQTYANAQQQQPFGILNGVAVLLGSDSSVAWVPTGSATGNLDIRVDRRAGKYGSGISTGVSFRVTDDKNYFFAYTSGESSSKQTLTVGYYLSGQRTTLTTGVTMPATWTTLVVVTMNSGTINVYADSSLVYSTTSNAMVSASGTGLYSDKAATALVNRWDNFTVYDAP